MYIYVWTKIQNVSYILRVHVSVVFQSYELFYNFLTYIHLCALLMSYVTASINEKQLILSKVFVFIFLDGQLSHNNSIGIGTTSINYIESYVVWLSVWMYIKIIFKTKVFFTYYFNHVRCIIYVTIVVNFVLFCIRKKRHYCSIWLIYFPLPLEIR